MTDVKGTPFSFFKYIFWNTSIDLNGEVGKKILAHEVAHVEANHSFDKLLIELQLIIGWFNPITWLIRNELYLIHEFIADQKSIQNNDTSVLAELLLASAYPSQQHILSNSFFFSPIKRRIQMFTKTNTKYSYLRRLTILPIMAATVLLFAFRNGNLNSKPIIKLDKQYTVIIDAGHGGDDLGASSADGTNEKDLTLSIAQKVKALNNNPNINIILSRESDKFINVVDRANFANASNANLFVSIHMDKAGTAKFSGTTFYVPSKNKVYFKESIMIANNLLDATSELFPKSKITTREMGIWVLENVKMPSVLFESGFISNPNDLKIVKANEEKIANMLLDGITSYLSSSNKFQGNVDTLLTVKSSSSKDIVEIKLDTIPAKKVNKINLQNKVDDVAVVSYSSVDTGGISTVFVAPKIQKNADPQKNNEPIFYTTQKPAESPAGWSTYLMNNLDRDLPYRNKAVTGKYTVRLSFVVNQNGDVENVIAENDPGYGTAKEAVRVIQNGPKWIPAEQEGKKVNSLVKQVIIFNVNRK